MSKTIAKQSRVNTISKPSVREPRSDCTELQTSLAVEERRVLVADRPITFEQWLDSNKWEIRRN